MLSAQRRAEGARNTPQYDRTASLLDGQAAGFVAALFSGGDSRMAADPRTGLNRYLCPQRPAQDLTCLSSCTASPISAHGFERAAASFLAVAGAQSAGERSYRLAVLTEQIKDRLLDYFRARSLAQVILCPSGTDALLTTAVLITRSRPGRAMTAVIPASAETGTGVPMAVTCRAFDGPQTGRALADCAGTTVEIPLRSANGSPLSDDAVNSAFAAATAAASGQVIVYLTHSTKTGLIAPVSLPRGVDVIVDASQARIAPETVAAYLALGWPVIVTGSKFFGGPAFSGAVLFPRDRLENTALAGSCDDGCFGTALRWTAAIAAIDRLQQPSAHIADVLRQSATEVEQELDRNPALLPVGGLQPSGSTWAEQPSIFTFGVRDPRDHGRLLTQAELRPLYERLAQRGILLGQPVGLGSFGGLRVAIGARNLSDDTCNSGLVHVFATLRELLQEAAA